MKSYPWVRDAGLAGTGSYLDQVGQAFRDATSRGMQLQVELKKGKKENKGIRVMCAAFIEYFRA